MAAIQNDRDVLLQAASVRVVPVTNPELDAVVAATKGVKLSAPSTVFSVPAAGAPGVTTPASIVIEAKLTLITGGVMWDVYAGSATLSASGNTCTLIPSLVTSPSVTVRARVVFEGITYTDYWTVAMVKDGAAGEMLGLTVYSNADTFARSGAGTVPTAITLTAQMLGGLTGTVSWSVVAGSATLSPSGATCSVNGPSVTGYSVTVMAQVVKSGITYQARYTLSKLGALSAADAVSLTTQVTGQLANGNVSGLGALALLNTVNLNTQTVGALNLATQTSGKIDANTQVNNLGNLAFANALAANQIGAGQLAAGVIYAGTVNATQVSAGSFSGREFTGGTFTGALFRTAASGPRFEIRDLGVIEGFDSSGASTFMLTRSGTLALYGESLGPAPLLINPKGKCHMRLAGKSSFPSSSSAGDVLMHTTHGLCIYTGSVWKACNMISI